MLLSFKGTKLQIKVFFNARKFLQKIGSIRKLKVYH